MAIRRRALFGHSRPARSGPSGSLPVAVGLLLAALVLLAPTRPARDGQTVGWALAHDLDPRFEVVRLSLVAALPAAAALFSRGLRRRGRPEPSPGGRLPRVRPRPRRSSPARRDARLAVAAPCLFLAGLSAALFLSTPPNLDLFEDGHALLPVQAYASGARPYRDVVPVHGWIADGGLQWAAARLAGDSVASIQRVESVFRLLFWPSVFLLALAATRRPGLSLAGVLLLFLDFPQAGFARAIPALLALALALHAMRSRRRVLWFLAGSAAAAAALFAIEFGTYAALAGLTAAGLSRGRRRTNVARFLSGGAAVALAALAAAWAGGALSAVVFVHAAHLPALFPIYAFGLRTVLAPPWWSESSKLFFVAGLFVAGGVLGRLAQRWPRPGAALRSLAPVSVFFLLASLSVVDRHHYSYPLVVLPAFAAVAFRSLRGMDARVRAAALSAAGLFLVAAMHPFSVLDSALSRLGPAQIPPGWVRMERPARTSGVYLRTEDARLVAQLDAFLEEGGLPPGETWLDFANAPALYYLFDRRPPIRYADVPFFQPEAARAEVSAALAADRRIGAVLVAGGGRIAESVDGIDNRVRAPEVWRMIERCFEPGFERSGVAIWRRRPGGCVPP